jgi:hypothetical protein
MNKFKLDLPENGFGFPCNICANRIAPVDACKDCTGYGGAIDFPVDRSDLRGLMEAVEP